jgi:hypothetical protein
MKILTYLLSVGLLFIIVDCKNDIIGPNQILSIPDLYEYCEVSNTLCGQLVKHDGEIITVNGVINNSNIFPDELRLLIFNSESPGMATQVTVISDSQSIFEKVFSIANDDGNNSYEVKIESRITSLDLPINDTCHVGIILELSSANDICFVE